DGIRDFHVTGVQTCALPIFHHHWGGADLCESARRRTSRICLTRWLPNGCCNALRHVSRLPNHSLGARVLLHFDDHLGLSEVATMKRFLTMARIPAATARTARGWGPLPEKAVWARPTPAQAVRAVVRIDPPEWCGAAFALLCGPLQS